MDEDFSSFVQQFLDDSERRLDGVHALCDAGDYPAVKQAAHSFKGSTLNLGLPAMAEACLQLEQAAQCTDSIAVSTALAHLQACWQQSKPALISFGEQASH